MSESEQVMSAPVEAGQSVQAPLQGPSDAGALLQTPVQQQPEPAQVPQGLSPHVPADLLSQANLSNFKSVQDLAKSYVNLQKLVGNSVRIPAEDAPVETRQEFLEKIKNVDGVLLRDSEDLYSRLGRPQDPDKYDFTEEITQDIRDTFPSITDEESMFKNIAFEAGLNDKQAKALVKMRMDEIQKHQQQDVQYKDSAKQALKDQWGKEYDNRIKAAQQVAKIYKEKFGDYVDQLVNGPAGSNPALINMLTDLGQLHQEHSGHVGLKNKLGGLTPEMARQKIAERRADKNFLSKYLNGIDPGHEMARQEMENLYKIANGG